MIDPERYNINLRRVTVDGEMLYEARVREFPDATEYAESAQEAYELALDTVEASLEVLQERGKTPPNPSETPEDYSGRVTLRVPKNLHRRLALAAEDEAISLNQYLVSLLAFHTGTAFSQPSDHAESGNRKYKAPASRLQGVMEKKARSRRTLRRPSFTKPKARSLILIAEN